MQFFARIVVEADRGCWFAWFNHQPLLVCRGQDWVHAVTLLIDLYGSRRLKWEQIIPVDEVAAEDRAEFLVPYVGSQSYFDIKSLN